jgi:hypothetical protein
MALPPLSSRFGKLHVMKDLTFVPSGIRHARTEL